MAQVSVFQKPRGQHILQFSTLRCIKMRISPRWYAVPVNLVLLIILLYLLAFSLKQARVVPDINEGAFVAAAIRRVHFFWSVISSQVLRYQGIQTSVKPAFCSVSLFMFDPMLRRFPEVCLSDCFAIPAILSCVLDKNCSALAG